jgi:hypothetical protein
VDGVRLIFVLVGTTAVRIAPAVGVAGAFILQLRLVVVRWEKNLGIIVISRHSLSYQHFERGSPPVSNWLGYLTCSSYGSTTRAEESATSASSSSSFAAT